MGNRREAKTTTWQLILGAMPQTLTKLCDLRRLLQNPTMAVVFCANLLLTALLLFEIWNGGTQIGFHTALLIALWLTSLFANFSEAIAEGRGRAQAASLRTLQAETFAKRLKMQNDTSSYDTVRASELQVDDLVLAQKGDIIPCDGEVVEGIALVDESPVTGESAPVVREAGGDVTAVTGGTTILSDWIVFRVTAKTGEGFLEQMIQLIEGAQRRKTPNEQALNIVLGGFTLVFIIVVATLEPLYRISGSFTDLQIALDPFIAVSLLVCLLPTTIGGLLPAIGIAGIDRMIRHNILAVTPNAVEAAGDVDTLLLDKTGTITIGNRQAAEFFPAEGISIKTLAEAALISSLADETAEGKSIVRLAKEGYGVTTTIDPATCTFIPFTAKTRMSGVTCPAGSYRKGALDAITDYVRQQGMTVPQTILTEAASIARNGGTPIVVANDSAVLGVIYLKDIVKTGLKERFAHLRKMGIRTVMITGDNQLTAVAIAAEAGVDECFGEATPEDKLRIIEKYQNEGHMVAMTGDGSNDAPALAKADVAMAMNSGTQAAREAANLIDLDSDPTKLIEAVGIGKQLLMTRGAMTTFSIANDVAKYFVLIPVIFLPICPQISTFNIMGLASTASACLSCVLFNATIILALIPLALRGVHYHATDAQSLFCRNLYIWGTSGILVPFVGIKAIDIIMRLFA